MSKRSYMVRETLAMATGLASGGVLSSTFQATEADRAAIDLVVLQVIGQFVLLEEPAPAPVRAWMAAVPAARLLVAARELRRTLRSLALPEDHADILDADGLFDGPFSQAVRVRDEAEGVLVGLRRTMSGRPGQWGGFWTHDTVVAMRDDLDEVLSELAYIATRADVARALGPRAGLIGTGWWGRFIPSTLAA